jgi:hypothetical protein
VGERLPFLTADGTLSIPFDSPERYHWWKGGQSVSQTLKEVKERMKQAAAGGGNPRADGEEEFYGDGI